MQGSALLLEMLVNMSIVCLVLIEMRPQSRTLGA